MIDILYEDKFIAVCVKPVGVLSQSDGERDMVCALREQIGGEIYPIHRLDRQVGGVMVFARDSRSAAIISSQIQSGGFVKRYLAVVHGIPSEPSGEMTDILFRDSQKNKSFVVSRPRRGTRDARLEYELLGSAQGNSNACSLVRIRLHTGRTHQIRVQFSSRKMPLLGDGKYGSRDNGCNIALWSHQITFAHPKNGAKMDFESTPDMSRYPWNLFVGQ